AGKVFVMRSDLRSVAHFVGVESADLDSWFVSLSKIDKGLSYYPNPLRAALLFEVDVPANSITERTIVLTCVDNAALVFDQVHESFGKVREVYVRKYAEDVEFWS